MSDVVTMLRKGEKDGVDGWWFTMAEAADEIEKLRPALNEATEARRIMGGALQIVVKNCRDADMVAVAQAALDLNEHGADACAQMRGDGPKQL